jgi:hypothetical protein
VSRVLIIAIVLAISGGGSARADVAWDAPAACPDRAAVLARIAAELGRELDPAAVDVAGRVERAGARWRVTLRLGAGERVLEAAACDELVATTALVVALAIDAGEAAAAPPAAVAAPVIAPAVDGETPPPRAIGLPTAVTTTAPRRAAPTGLGLRVRASIGGAAGGLPENALGVAGAVELARGPWALDAGGSRWLTQEASNDGSPRGVEIAMTTVALRGCRVLADTGGWRVNGCAGGELDLLRSRPFGFLVPGPAQTLVGGGVTVGAAVARQVAGPLWFRLDADAAVLLRTVVLREGDPENPDMLGVTVHDTGRSILRLFLAAEVRIP